MCQEIFSEVAKPA